MLIRHSSFLASAVTRRFLSSYIKTVGGLVKHLETACGLKKNIDFRRGSGDLRLKECVFCDRPHKNQPTNLFTLHVRSNWFLCYRCQATGGMPKLLEQMSEVYGVPFPIAPVRPRVRVIEDRDINLALHKFAKGHMRRRLHNMGFSDDTLSNYALGIAGGNLAFLYHSLSQSGGDIVPVSMRVLNAPVPFGRFTPAANAGTFQPPCRYGGIFGLPLLQPFMRKVSNESEIQGKGRRRKLGRVAILTSTEVEAMAAFQLAGVPAVALDDYSVFPAHIAAAVAPDVEFVVWSRIPQIGQTVVELFGSARVRLLDWKTYEHVPLLDLLRSQVRVAAMRANSPNAVPVSTTTCSGPSANGVHPTGVEAPVPRSADPRGVQFLTSEQVLVKKALRRAPYAPCSHLTRASSFRKELLEYLRTFGEPITSQFGTFEALGAALRPIFNVCKGLRSGEVSVWSGPEHVGKTTCLSHLAVEICRHARLPTFWVSFRDPPLQTVIRVASQFQGVSVKTVLMRAIRQDETKPREGVPNGFLRVRDLIDSVPDEEEFPFYVADFRFDVTLNRLMQLVKYAHNVKGARHIVLDGLNFPPASPATANIKILDDVSEYSNEATGWSDPAATILSSVDLLDAAMFMLREFARRHGVHISIVANSRKSHVQYWWDTANIAGPTSLTRLASSVILVQRFKFMGTNTRYLEIVKNSFDGTCPLLPMEKTKGERYIDMNLDAIDDLYSRLKLVYGSHVHGYLTLGGEAHQERANLPVKWFFGTLEKIMHTHPFSKLLLEDDDGAVPLDHNATDTTTPPAPEATASSSGFPDDEPLFEIVLASTEKLGVGLAHTLNIIEHDETWAPRVRQAIINEVQQLLGNGYPEAIQKAEEWLLTFHPDSVGYEAIAVENQPDAKPDSHECNLLLAQKEATSIQLDREALWLECARIAIGGPEEAVLLPYETSAFARTLVYEFLRTESQQELRSNVLNVIGKNIN
eukprot:Rmarinus@m.14386